MRSLRTTSLQRDGNVLPTTSRNSDANGGVTCGHLVSQFDYRLRSVQVGYGAGHLATTTFEHWLEKIQFEQKGYFSLTEMQGFSKGTNLPEELS